MAANGSSARERSRSPAAVATTPESAKIGLVQMCSRNDKEVNFQECARLVGEAAAQGCQLVALPECFSFIGARPGEAQIAAEPLSGPTMQRYCALARQHGLWLSLGGFQERPAEGTAEGEGGQAKILNTHVVIDGEGGIKAVYRKIHLFDAPFTGLVESKQAIPGSEVVFCDTPVGRLGVTICYDVRFPELYQNLRFGHGCDILLVPSAFTMETGEAHWETLMRSRAIECQCYVFAAAQAGRHNEDGNKRTSWGHSLAVDPWGKVLADMGGTDVGLRVVDIGREALEGTRNRMPLVSQRRYDIYGNGK
mmetsp:Transcript_29524/g.74190  ORF Transcript_29524/g.74190 Transcript_29524/m.74190 type:complete len:308 (-) Transcript_29524:63-986(-)